MTDTLTSLAILGTSRGGEPPAIGEARVDAVLSSSADATFETRVLLAAGVRSVARFAGARARTGVATPRVADPETRSACSPRFDAMLSELLAETDAALLVEALTALDRAGLRLTHARLADAINGKDATVRRAFAGVAGARGAWLGSLVAGLGWLNGEALRDLEAIERAWPDAKSGDRVALLTQARALDATKARGWVEGAWATEKADDRAALIGALATSLSNDDEPFLQTALGDRSQGVRERAVDLLSRLPSSALVGRMSARANAAVGWGRDDDAQALVIEWPAQWTKDDVRDALVSATNAGSTARPNWSLAIVSSLPLAYWTDRFARSPEQLIAAGASTTGVIEGWTRAAARERNVAWSTALLRHWQQIGTRDTPLPPILAAMTSLLRALPSEIACREVESRLETSGRLPITELLSAVSPWTVSLSRAYLAVLASAIAGGSNLTLHHGIEHAAHALSPLCFDDALALTAPPEVPWIARALERFQHVVRVRQVIALEARSPHARRQESVP